MPSNPALKAYIDSLRAERQFMGDARIGLANNMGRDGVIKDFFKEWLNTGNINQAFNKVPQDKPDTRIDESGGFRTNGQVNSKFWEWIKKVLEKDEATIKQEVQSNPTIIETGYLPTIKKHIRKLFGQSLIFGQESDSIDRLIKHLSNLLSSDKTLA